MKLKSLILYAALALAAALPVKAQTFTNILGSVETWGSSFNTNNLALSIDIVRVETGPVLVQGATVADRFGVYADLWHLDPVPASGASWVISLGSDTDNSGIAGTITGEYGNVEVGYVKYDFKIYGKLGGGYDFKTESIEGNLGIGVDKMVSKNAYTGLETDIPIEKDTKVLTPGVYVIAGLNF